MMKLKVDVAHKFCSNSPTSNYIVIPNKIKAQIDDMGGLNCAYPVKSKDDGCTRKR